MRHQPRTSFVSKAESENLDPTMRKRGYRLIKSFDVPSSYPVSIWNGGKKGYSVVYGLQVMWGVPYSDACAELGECLMHALACAGLCDSE